MTMLGREPWHWTEAVRRKCDRISAGHKPTVFDMFSGCGGFSLGFQRAGFNILGGIDIDPEAAASHETNFRGVALPRKLEDCGAYARDITSVQPLDLTGLFGPDDGVDAVDVLIGGPPCQSYARVGRAKLREIADKPDAYKVDPRGSLYLRYIEYVRRLAPLVIVMENVPDVLNYGGHNIAEETANVLEDVGYECRYTLLNAVYYGVPQMRERMFLIAYHRLLQTDVRFPEPTHCLELPRGYLGTRQVALRRDQPPHYLSPPSTRPELEPAVTTKEALADLPRITDHREGGYPPRNLRLGATRQYREGQPNAYGRQMRYWPGFESTEVTCHVTRRLPRDYRIFEQMKPGDEYPQALELAKRLFEQHVEQLRRAGQNPGDVELDEVRRKFVPPYDAGKFPNKWRKMEADQPARTVMAHLGKDSYSHIHFDSTQARTISVREAARLQSFPDGFVFAGAMNAAFRQIGNAVPPLLAWRIAEKIMADALRS
ncbi:MAG: DNA cytosine methyltransferase [Alphaproteobacteria bacterium]